MRDVQLNYRTDMSVHISTCTSYNFNALMPVVWKCEALIKCVKLGNDVKIITGDETWCFPYDTKSKQQSLHVEITNEDNTHHILQ
jgi:hypothetical protein